MDFNVTLNKDWLEDKNIIPKNTILLGYVGSISQGLNIDNNDEDLMGVCIGPKNVYYGLSKYEQSEVKYTTIDNVTIDSVVYEIRKFFRLLIKQNPTTLSLLWLRPEYYIHISKLGQKILDNRDLFLSKEMYHSFTGYAHSQLMRMEKYDNSAIGKRKILIDKFGYDCKNATHLIRLLKMCIEFLNTHVLNVYRENDTEELKEIKSGLWSLDNVKKYANDLFNDTKYALEKSTLPNKVDFALAEVLLMLILNEYF